MKSDGKINRSANRMAVAVPNGTIDTAFKVMGSMNFPQRKKRLEAITEKNFQIYERLRNVESTV